MNEQATEDQASFSDFWLLWPRRIAKKDALKAWSKLTDNQRIAAIVGLVEWRRVWHLEYQRREDYYDYLPYPATWLNGERWEDEIPQRYQMNGHAFPAAVVAEPEERMPMPEHVRKLLAGLKAKNGLRAH